MEHLRLSSMDLSIGHQDNRHAQTVMKDLGITYRYAVPQSISDQWWFLDCKNIPLELPSYLTYMNIENPMKLVGWGLSKEMAQDLIDNGAILDSTPSDYIMD